MMALYWVLTHEPDTDDYTHQIGLPPNPLNGRGELRRALRLLRDMGYAAIKADPSVLVERVDAEEARRRMAAMEYALHHDPMLDAPLFTGQTP